MTKEKTATTKQAVKKTVKKTKKSVATKVKDKAGKDEIVKEILYSEKEIETIEAEFEDFRQWLINKPYLINNKTQVLKHVLTYLRKYAKWTLKTGAGLDRIYNEIKGISKQKEAYVSSMQLHAMWFFLKDIEPTGLDDAKYTLEIDQYVRSVHDNYQFDYSYLQLLENKRLAAHQQVKMSTEDINPAILEYNEKVKWKDDWKHLKNAIDARKDEVAKEEAAAAEKLAIENTEITEGDGEIKEVGIEAVK